MPPISDAMTIEHTLYTTHPVEWAKHTAPNLLRCLRADIASGAAWTSRWVWVSTEQCRALHAEVLDLADDALRGVLWSAEPIAAQAILLGMLSEELREPLWRNHTSSATRRAIKEHVERIAFARASEPRARRHREQPGLFA